MILSTSTDEFTALRIKQNRGTPSTTDFFLECLKWTRKSIRLEDKNPSDLLMTTFSGRPRQAHQQTCQSDLGGKLDDRCCESSIKKMQLCKRDQEIERTP
jgi:hypothetical protein